MILCYRGQRVGADGEQVRILVFLFQEPALEDEPEDVLLAVELSASTTSFANVGFESSSPSSPRKGGHRTTSYPSRTSSARKSVIEGAVRA